MGQENRRFRDKGSLEKKKSVLGVFEKIGVDMEGGGNTQYLVLIITHSCRNPCS